MANQIDELKKMAAEAAVDYVQSGMVIGLGYGSTVIHALRAIGKMIRSGRLERIVGVPTAESVAQAAEQEGIPLTTLEEYTKVDLTIDGADEVDPQLNLIKGGGGALLREKIVAQASERLVIVVDETKLSDQLGNRFSLPIEVIPFGWGSQARFLETLGAKVGRRESKDGAPFITDNRNYILDCDFGPLSDLSGLAQQLESKAGIVEHGLFLGLADEVVVGMPDGIRRLTR